jgi:pimeloyl-ACP methyl ester carboxylesterase
LSAVVEAVRAPFVFGHSSGGILALRAVAGGLPIRRLAVNEPPYILASERPLPPADITARLRALISEGNREQALRVFLLEHVAMPAKTVDGLAASPAWTQMLALAHTVPYDSELSGTSELPRELVAKVRVPTLVFHCGASAPWLTVTAREIAQLIPGAQLVLLEAQPHSPAPAVLAPHLLRFFA